MKKILSVVLAAAMATGMTVASFAATVKNTYKIDTVVGEALTVVDVDKISPTDRERTIALTADMFTWKDSKGNAVEVGKAYKDGAIVADGTADSEVLIPTGSSVTESQLRNGKVTVKTTIAKGSGVIDEVKFDGSAIKVKFVKDFVSTKDVDFDFSVYLLDNKNRVESTKVNLAGTYANKTVEVDADDNDVYAGDKVIVKATEYIPSIKVDLGNDVYLTTKMFTDKKYYGFATNEPDASDDAMLSKYNDIQVVYTLKTVGFNTGDVTFAISDKYYVYDKDGKYLGTTADKLALSTKYYLTAKKLDINTAADVEDDEEVSEAPAENTNTNNNPETGVNGLVNVAVVAGVVALAAAGAVALKK